MNTIGSVYYGWAFLIACGGGSYYFAKRSINRDRAERQALENQRRMTHQRQMAERSHYERLPASKSKTTGSGHPSPSQEASGGDPAPTSHAGSEKSKFEASEPFRSPKGDRFS